MVRLSRQMVADPYWANKLKLVKQKKSGDVFPVGGMLAESLLIKVKCVVQLTGQ